MEFPTIVMIALVGSLLVPIGMALLAPPAARRTALLAWGVLMPTLALSCGIMASQAERAFLSPSQAVGTGSILLSLSFGLGYIASKFLHAKPNVKPPVLPE